jgi:hypothetical protein
VHPADDGRRSSMRETLIQRAEDGAGGGAARAHLSMFSPSHPSRGYWAQTGAGIISATLIQPARNFAPPIFYA